MTKEQVLGVIRHSLTFVGGVLVTKGLIEDSLATEIIGGAISLIGLVWSVFLKKSDGSV